MKIIILGANGMIGFSLLKYLSKFHDVTGTLRKEEPFYKDILELKEQNIVFGIDVRDTKSIEIILDRSSPDILINATGIVKQITEKYKKSEIIELNALTPHKLSEITSSRNIKLIQFSTDCVFSGEKGNYSEDDLPDPKDLYGLSKYIGEVNQKGALTIRTSTIGLELTGSHGLIEWFLGQTKAIHGYVNAIYSGVTTYELAKFIQFIITNFKDIDGLWQFGGGKISKFELLSILCNKIQKQDVEIFPNEEYICDRSFINNKIIDATNYKVPNWEVMLGQLAKEIKSRGVSK